MPIPEEFIKKRTEVTVSRASLEAMTCKSCGAKIDTKDIQNGYAKCGFCGSAFALSVDGQHVA